MSLAVGYQAAQLTMCDTVGLLIQYQTEQDGYGHRRGEPERSTYAFPHTDYSSFDVRILVVHAVAGIAAVGLTAAHHFAFNQHWTLSNIIALSFSYNAISLLRLDSFFTGAALLGGESHDHTMECATDAWRRTVPL